MSRSSPSVDRVVAVLNFFAEHAGQAFTFTEVVTALKLGRATCHALLTGLVDSQYLYRNRDKTYVIGPALVAIGEVAKKQFSPLQVAQPEIRSLADQFGGFCSIIALEKDELVLKARAGVSSDLGWAVVHQPKRFPVRIASAGVFLSRLRQSEVDEWVDHFAAVVTKQQHEDLLNSIKFVRRHGFNVTMLNTPVEDVSSEVLEGKSQDFPVSQMMTIRASSHYRVASLTSPVFDRDGNTVFVLNLSGIDGEIAGKKILEMGAALKEACGRITDFIACVEPGQLTQTS